MYTLILSVVTKTRAGSIARKRRSDVNWENVAAGAVLGGIAGLVLGTALSSAKTAAPPVLPEQRLVIGGIDLTGLDFTTPFWVDFSVGPTASLDAKRFALSRIRYAVEALSQQFPTWACDTDVDARAGHFVLIVNPLPAYDLLPYIAGR